MEATTTQHGQGPSDARHPSWGLVAVGAVLVAVVVIAPAVVTTVAAGAEPYQRTSLTFPGTGVGVAASIGQALADLAATLTFGALSWLLFLRSTPGRAAARLSGSTTVTVLQLASAAWATSASAMVVVDLLDRSGMPLATLAEPGALSTLYAATDYPRAWTVAACAAAVTLVASLITTRWTGLLIPLGASVFGVLAPVVVGQISVGPGHDIGTDAGVIQTLAASALWGIVLVAVIRVCVGESIDPTIQTRVLGAMSALLAAVIATDLVLAAYKLNGPDALRSVTAAQIATRALCWLLFAAALGAAWRWRGRGPLSRRQVSAVLAAATTAAAGWLGVTAAMTRIPPPHYFAPTSITEVYLGFTVPDPPTVGVLLTHWRVNLLFLVIAGVAVSVYVAALRVLRRRGDHWPTGRTVSWLLGWAVVVVVTSSGLGKYSAPDFGVHMIVHMSLNMLAPILLVMGGPVTLLLRATRAGHAPHDWLTMVLHWPVLRLIANPLVVFIAFVGSYYGLYFTGAFATLMPLHWAHQLMNLHFLAVGCLFYWLVIGVDRPPRPLPHIGKLGFVLAAMPFHAFFGVALMSTNEIIAENFYRSIDLPWSDLPASQYLAGGVAWAGGELPLLIVIIALGVRWSRDDARGAQRTDRHYDLARDDEFSDYNRMLGQLSTRASHTPAPHDRTPERHR